MVLVLIYGIISGTVLTTVLVAKQVFPMVEVALDGAEPEGLVLTERRVISVHSRTRTAIRTTQTYSAIISVTTYNCLYML